MRKKHNFFSIIVRNSMQYFLKAGWWGIAEQMTAVFRALLCMLEIMGTKRLFDEVTNGTDFYNIAISLLFLTLVIALQQFLSGFGQYLFSKVSYTNMGKFMVDFQHKLGKLPAIYFEDPKFLDQVEKAKECLEYESLGHFASICLQMITYYLIYLIAVGEFLFHTSPLLPLILLLAFIPTLIAQIIKAKYFIDLEEVIAPERRRCEAYKQNIVHINSYKETRMLGAYKYFYQLFVDSLHLMTEKRWKTEKKLIYLQVALNVVTFIVLGISIYILFIQMMYGFISVGMFTAVFVSISDVFSIMEELISSHLSEGSEILGQVANFYSLMDLEESSDVIEHLEFSHGVVAKDISFVYPESKKNVFSHISLHIDPQETIAIVGENGSGKSTLVKVLTGIYAPRDGYMKIGGIDVKRLSLGCNFPYISGIFQNFQRYKLTLQENVCISELKEKNNLVKIKKKLNEAQFEHPTVTMNTILSPEFGGTDLSGGQWQRLAIARGLFKENKFIILDEPTAAIDPIEESKLYKQFKNIVEGRCAIIVTHRLGAAKFADRIIVMADGNIVEMGTHDELMKKDGKYRFMWEAQAMWYQK